MAESKKPSFMSGTASSNARKQEQPTTGSLSATKKPTNKKSNNEAKKTSASLTKSQSTSNLKSSLKSSTSSSSLRSSSSSSVRNKNNNTLSKSTSSSSSFLSSKSKAKSKPKPGSISSNAWPPVSTKSKQKIGKEEEEPAQEVNTGNHQVEVIEQNPYIVPESLQETVKLYASFDTFVYLAGILNQAHNYALSCINDQLVQSHQIQNQTNQLFNKLEQSHEINLVETLLTSSSKLLPLKTSVLLEYQNNNNGSGNGRGSVKKQEQEKEKEHDKEHDINKITLSFIEQVCTNFNDATELLSTVDQDSYDVKMINETENSIYQLQQSLFKHRLTLENGKLDDQQVVENKGIGPALLSNINTILQGLSDARTILRHYRKQQKIIM